MQLYLQSRITTSNKTGFRDNGLMMPSRMALLPVIVLVQILVWAQPAVAAAASVPAGANLVQVDAAVSANGRAGT